MKRTTFNFARKRLDMDGVKNNENIAAILHYDRVMQQSERLEILSKFRVIMSQS